MNLCGGGGAQRLSLAQQLTRWRSSPSEIDRFPKVFSKNRSGVIFPMRVRKIGRILWLCAVLTLLSRMELLHMSCVMQICRYQVVPMSCACVGACHVRDQIITFSRKAFERNRSRRTICEVFSNRVHFCESPNWIVSQFNIFCQNYFFTRITYSAEQ